MLRACVTIVTIDMVEQRNLGNVNIKFYTLMVCVKIAILTNIKKPKEGPELFTTL